MSELLFMPGGDPAALERLAGELEAAAAGADSLAGSTRQVTSDIRTTADWTGDAADSYSAFTGNLTSGVSSANAPLRKISSAVRDYASYLRAAQDKVTTYSSAARVAEVTGSLADVTAANAAGQDAQSALTAQQTAGDTAATRVRAATAELEHLFGLDGPVRSWIERIHAPWDSLAGDAAVARFLARVKTGEEVAEQAKDFANELPELMKANADALEGSLDARNAGYAERVEATLQLADDYEALWDWNEKFLKAGEELTKGANLARGVAVESDVLGLAGDYFTMRKPENAGTMGWVDRGVAAVNAGASVTDGTYAVLGVLNATVDEFPVVGQVVLIGSGLYLGGDYLYHNWTPFRDVSDAVGHATVASADAVGHAAANEAKGLWHGITSIF